MCIIILKPQGQKLSKGLLANCWMNNRDGGGFMFAQNGQLSVVKEIRSFKRWYKKYRDIKPDEKTVVIHFRIGTSGEMDVKNCHPHSITQNLAFAHNGIIPIDVPENSKVSDTIIFRDRILRHLPNGFIKNHAVLTLIADYVGKSKLVFMDAQGHAVIVNEYMGHWKHGCWFSNNSYEYKSWRGRRAITTAGQGWRGTSAPYSPSAASGQTNFITDRHGAVRAASQIPKKEVVQMSDYCDCGNLLYSPNEKEVGMCKNCQAAGLSSEHDKPVDITDAGELESDSFGNVL